jgi:hypothetical protein
MLFRKLRNVKRFFRKRGEEEPPQIETCEVGNAADSLNADVDMSSLVCIRKIKERLESSNKKFFDSADHFMNLSQALEVEKTERESLEADLGLPPNPLETVLETAADIAADVAVPLESAYSEMVEEMKPKKSV